MFIDKYVTNQYAGIKDCDISFTPGLNVILGSNEAGKSTMINSIFNTLFMTSSFNKRNTVDKNFLNYQFPLSNVNFIDGEVHLICNNQKIIIKKEWNKIENTKGKTCVSFENTREKWIADEAEKELQKLLVFGRDVYDNIVFGRQNNENEILDWFFSFLNHNNSKDSINQAYKIISSAVSAAGGISEELFEKKLTEKINDLLGKHWDPNKRKPMTDKGKERDIDNKWLKDVGTILEKYYEWKEKEKDYNNYKDLIDTLNENNQLLKEKKQKKEELETQKNTLQEHNTAINLNRLLANENEKLQKLQHIKTDWPKLCAEKEQLNDLQNKHNEKDRRNKKACLEDIIDNEKKIREDYEPKLAGLENLPKDFEEYKSLKIDIENIKLRLGAVEFHTQVKLLQNNTMQMETNNGFISNISGNYDGIISGYAKIIIPNVAEIMFSPKDLDVKLEKTRIKENEDKMESILKKYLVHNADELEKKSTEYTDNFKEKEELERKLKILLGEKNIENIIEEYENIKIDSTIDVPDDLDNQIEQILTNKDEQTLEARLAVIDNILQSYETEYISEENLQEKIDTSTQYINDNTAPNDANISEEDYNKQIQEIEETLNGNTSQKGLVEEIEDLIGDTARYTEKADGIDLDELEDDENQAKDSWEKAQKLYDQYVSIQNKFNELKENNDKYADFYNLFNEYLKVATGGTLQIQNSKILSKEYFLPEKQYLSQGTKNVILLAFRLALLQYYYREESGVIFLDDILLDMDPERRQQSVKMLNNFAEKNQVIFTTCDPAIADLLGGNRITI